MKALIASLFIMTSLSTFAAELNCKIDSDTMRSYNDWAVIKELSLNKNPTAKIILARENSSAVIGKASFGVNQGYKVQEVTLSNGDKQVSFSVPRGSNQSIQKIDLMIKSDAVTKRSRMTVLVREMDGFKSEPVAVFNCL